MAKKSPHPKAARTLVECSPHRTTGGGHFIGLTERNVEYEYRNEAHAIHTLVLCHDVHKISSQPITEPYEHLGTTHRYTPDFIVDTFLPGLRIEVKSVENLLKDTARSDKYLAIAAMYTKAGIGFAFLVDAQLEQQPRFSNVQLLHRYVTSNAPADTERRALAALSKAPLSVTELKTRANVDLVDIWTLIARRRICFDWATRLDPQNTLLSLPNQPFEGLKLEDVLRSTRFGDSLAALAVGRRTTDQRVLADAETWRRPDRHPEPWSFVGGTDFTTPIRDLGREERLPRSPERRRDFTLGIGPAATLNLD